MYILPVISQVPCSFLTSSCIIVCIKREKDMNLITPENYEPVLSVMQTQEAIKYIRDTFQREFGKEQYSFALFNEIVDGCTR